MEPRYRILEARKKKPTQIGLNNGLPTLVTYMLPGPQEAGRTEQQDGQPLPSNLRVTLINGRENEEKRFSITILPYSEDCIYRFQIPNSRTYTNDKHRFTYQQNR